jgi:predicted amidohydrolase
MKRRTAVIALAQIKYFETSRTNNLNKIIKYIRLAKKAKADIVCFPESCIHYSTLDFNNKLIKTIVEECKKNSIWCIVTDDLTIKNKTYNSSLLIDREGKIKGKYDKINLYGDTASAGKKIRVFDTDFGRIGIAICWDLAFPKLFNEMKKMGAEIIFCPAQWWYDSKSHYEKHQIRELSILKSLVLSRAYENAFFVCLCNPIMHSKFQISYSAIASPTGILSEKINKEGLIVQKVNLNDILRVQKIYNS